MKQKLILFAVLIAAFFTASAQYGPTYKNLNPYGMRSKVVSGDSIINIISSDGLNLFTIPTRAQVKAWIAGSNFVTLNTDQTITGEKTFQNYLNFNNTFNSFSGIASASGIGFSNGAGYSSSLFYGGVAFSDSNGYTSYLRDGVLFDYQSTVGLGGQLKLTIDQQYTVIDDADKVLVLPYSPNLRDTLATQAWVRANVSGGGGSATLAGLGLLKSGDTIKADTTKLVYLNPAQPQNGGIYLKNGVFAVEGSSGFYYDNQRPDLVSSDRAIIGENQQIFRITNLDGTKTYSTGLTLSNSAAQMGVYSRDNATNISKEQSIVFGNTDGSYLNRDIVLIDSLNEKGVRYKKDYSKNWNSSDSTRLATKAYVDRTASGGSTYEPGYGLNLVSNVFNVDSTKIAYKEAGKITLDQLPDVNLDSTWFTTNSAGSITIDTNRLNSYAAAHGWGPSLPALAATSVTFGTSTSTQNVVNWSLVTNATNYLLKRSLNSGMTSPTTAYTGSLLTYTDTGLSPSTTYYYTVTASATGYTSSISSVANKTTDASGGATLVANFLLSDGSATQSTGTITSTADNTRSVAADVGDSGTTSTLAIKSIETSYDASWSGKYPNFGLSVTNEGTSPTGIEFLYSIQPDGALYSVIQGEQTSLFYTIPASSTSKLKVRVEADTVFYRVYFEKSNDSGATWDILNTGGTLSTITIATPLYGNMFMGESGTTYKDVIYTQ